MNCILCDGVVGGKKKGAQLSMEPKKRKQKPHHGRRKARRPFQEAKAEKKKALAAAKSTSGSRFLSRVCFFTDGGIVETFWMEAYYVPPCFSTYYLEALFRLRREVLRLRA